MSDVKRYSLPLFVVSEAKGTMKEDTRTVNGRYRLVNGTYLLPVNNLKPQSEYTEYLQSYFLDLKSEITSSIQYNRLLVEIQFVLIRYKVKAS